LIYAKHQALILGKRLILGKLDLENRSRKGDLASPQNDIRFLK